jgi:hypothetical protein
MPLPKLAAKHLRSAALSSAVLIGACSTSGSGQLPTYPYRGIDLSGFLSGQLTREENCVLVIADGERWVPIWPAGTVVVGEGVQVPERNGGLRIRFGQPAHLQGGKNPSSENLPGFSRVQACGGKAFLVNQVREKPYED